MGQYFTGGVISDYMASLIKKPQSDTVRILDAGAGTGVLTASTALQCLYLGCRNVHAVLYEVDIGASRSLIETLKVVEDQFRIKKCLFTYEVLCEDFILVRPDLDVVRQPFDISVINPPYFKYSVKNSPYAKVASDLYRGDPNIYASFMAVAMACLKYDGQLVTITPRSFTNGLYFKGLRTYLLKESFLNLIHIFKYRNKLFKSKNETVLQENIICHFVKGGDQKSVTVRSSDCDESVHNAEEIKYRASLIIDGSSEQMMIRIPASHFEAEVLKQAEHFKNTFAKIGYFISTGRVVEHRTRHLITRKYNTGSSIPLYRPHNVTPLVATWSESNERDVSFIVNEGHEKHTLVNENYVLLKRFSSKDEKKRLVSSVHLKSMCKEDLIGFGNKVNYIGVSGDVLSVAEAYGICAVFNSSFMDQYFRCVSGNTQVNATEIRVMKFPSREQVKAIGESVLKLTAFDNAEIDEIVNPVLGVSM